MKKLILLGLVATMAFALCAVTGAGSGQAAAPGMFAKACETVTAAAAARDYVKALSALKSLMVSLWAESALALSNVKFVKGADNSYGMYALRENDAFTAGEPIYLYAEPSGYVINKNAAGYFEFGFKADFQVADESGKVLGGQNEFAVMPFKSWNPNTEISITFTYTLSGLEKGKYKIITQVSDTHSAKKASCEKWFLIR